MFTSSQKWVIALWLGLPLAALIVITVINPRYAVRLLEAFGPVTGLTLVIALEIVNGLALWLGYSGLNRWSARRPADPRGLPHAVGILLAIVTLIVFTLPASWLVIFYPSLMILLETPSTF